MTYDPFPTLIRALQRGCTVEALEDPSGSSPFADEMALHSDGPDAIPAMHVMVNAGGAYLQWLGLFVNIQKSYKCAVNLADGLPMATDSITLRGSLFRVLLKICKGYCEKKICKRYCEMINSEYCTVLTCSTRGLLP